MTHSVGVEGFGGIYLHKEKGDHPEMAALVDRLIQENSDQNV